MEGNPDVLTSLFVQMVLFVKADSSSVLGVSDLEARCSFPEYLLKYTPFSWIMASSAQAFLNTRFMGFSVVSCYLFIAALTGEMNSGDNPRA